MGGRFPAFPLLILIVLTACALGASGCDAVESGDRNDDLGPADPAIATDRLSTEGPSLWVVGEAVLADSLSPFLFRRVSGQWQRTDLDLPYDSASLHALAGAGLADPWLAGEGLLDDDTGTYETFVYRIGRNAMWPVDPPRTDLAITAICPQGLEEAWAVGALRLPGTLAGYAGYFDGASWTDRTPEVGAGIVRWNLSGADFPQSDEGAALGLVSGDETGQGIVGALFLYADGVWTDVDLPYDPLADVYIFTDVHYAPDDVVVVGRVNLAGWIGHYDPIAGDWSEEDLSAFDRSPMWEINAVVGDGAGTRYALGSEDAGGLARPLLLVDTGSGWSEMAGPLGALAEPKHLQPRDAAFLSADVGAATVSEYYFGVGDSRQRDRLLSIESGAWVDVTPPMAEERYEFGSIAAVRVEE